MKQLRTPALAEEVSERANRLPAHGKGVVAGKWEGDGAGRMAMMLSIASERSVTQLECDQQSRSIVLADRETGIGGVFGNSYVMGHGSYPQ